jgi:hypothetical protein
LKCFFCEIFPQGSVLGPLLYLPYTADMSTSTESTTALYADDPVGLATEIDPSIASQKLQTNLEAIQKWLKKWKIKANEPKSVHFTFTTRREICPRVHINNVNLPQQEAAKYLGLHLNRRLSWLKHIFTKRKELGMTLTKMHWLLGRKSKLSIINNILI